MSETTAVEAKCYCGGFHVIFDVPNTALPLEAYLCHCSICRWGTGAPCTFHCGMPETVRPRFISPSKEESLSYYPVEGKGYGFKFCSTCGCHVAAIGVDDGSWTPSSSIFSRADPKIVQVKMQVFGKSTGDGGLSVMLDEINGKKLPSWNPSEDEPNSKVAVSKPEVGASGQELLRAQCHCAGVSFGIRRPSAEQLRTKRLKDNFISPVDERKWRGVYDPCDDCRLVSGGNFIGWTFVPFEATEPRVPENLELGTIKTFKSSTDVLRAFCGVCGATVFYYNQGDENGERVIDVATGILRAPEGSMAEGWLTWRSRLSHADDGLKYNEGLTKSLMDGLDRWSMMKYGQKYLMKRVD